MELCCYSLSHQQSSVEEREQLAFSTSRIETFAEAWKQTSQNECVIISTCNRTEIYLAGVSDPFSQAARLIDQHLQPKFDWKSRGRILRHEECTRHLFEVVSGLQSMVLGETEIFGQVKDHYQKAQSLQLTGKWLNKLFQTSFQVGKESRTQSMITHGSVSIGSVSVEMAEQIFGHLKDTQVLVLGAGQTSERVARTLKSKGACSFIVANRTFEKAEQLAREIGGTACTWDAWDDLLKQTDIIISSTSAPHPIVTKEKLAHAFKHRSARPLFLIDLAVPRDIESSVTDLDSVYLFNIDDLQQIAQKHMVQREIEAEKCRFIVARHASKFTAWFEKAKSLQETGELEVSAT